MIQLSKPEPVSGDAVLSAMRDSLFESISRANPALAQAVLSCAVPRWFDKEVAAGMCADGTVQPFDGDEVFQKLVSLAFCTQHPARANTWAFQRAFRGYFFSRRELTDRLAELHSRAAETFKRILDRKRLAGDRRFQDEDWRLVATEWLYHLLQIDQDAGVAELTKLCAEALAIPVYKGPSWEIDFCVRLLADLEWPSEGDALSPAIEDLRRGFGHLAVGRNMKALPMVKRLAGVPGLTPRQEGELHYFMGITHLYDEGRSGPALEEFREATRLAPDLAKVHAEIAAVHAVPGTIWGRLDLAEDSAREAIRVEPNQAEGHVALGRICAQQEDWAQAIAHYEKAIEVEPDDTDSYLALSDAYAARRDVAQAIQLIGRAWEISGRSEYAAALRRGDAHAGARDFRRARDEYQRATNLAPDQPAPWIGLGNWCESTSALSEAAEMYRKAIELDPALEDGYVALARLHDGQEKLAKAIDVCQRCVAKGAAGKGIYIELTSLYEQQERLPELESAQAELAALDWGERYGCHCATGNAWLSRARKRPGSPELSTWLEQAQAKIEQAIELDRNRAWAYVLLAELSILRGESDRLDEIEQLAAARAPWAQYDWLVTVAQTCLQYHDGERCESLLKRAVELAPNRTSAWPVVASLCAWQGDPAGVARAWASFVQLDPARQYDAHIALGDALLRVQDDAQAHQAYSKALATEPNTAQGYLSLSGVEEADGKPEEAIKLCQTAADRASGLAPIALTNIARLQREQRKFQAAEETLRRAIGLDPDQVETYMELARLGAVRDRRDLVTEASERVASISPHRRYDLYTALGDAYRSAGWRLSPRSDTTPASTSGPSARRHLRWTWQSSTIARPWRSVPGDKTPALPLAWC